VVHVSSKSTRSEGKLNILICAAEIALYRWIRRDKMEEFSKKVKMALCIESGRIGRLKKEELQKRVVVVIPYR